MKFNYLAAGTVIALLATTTIAFADTGVKAHGDLGIHLGQFINVGEKSDANGSANVDTDNDHDQVASSTFGATIAERLSHVTAGIVTSINGAIITIDPFGRGPTTTITTDASTTFKAGGSATSSSAITVGSRVVAVGTTTATSTTGDSFTASIVKIIGDGLGHLRFWLWFHNH